MIILTIMKKTMVKNDKAIFVKKDLWFRKLLLNNKGTMSYNYRCGWNTVFFATGITGLIILDTNIGYFECAKCHERFIPSVKDYTFGLHTLKKRKLTCPKCGKKTWCSKRINKNIEVNK